jgi:large subunit ribosomal protein L17
MRHRKKFNHLSRTSSHRKAMLSNMASSLIMHKRIKTTVAKAKALRMYVEPLINKSKTDNTHSRRIVFSHLQNKEAVSELFREISEKVANRPGGYTRILKLGNRQGDAAEICFIELVDYNENMLSETAGAAKKTTRRSRRGSKKSTVETTAAPAAKAAETAPEETQESKAPESGEDKKEE